MSTMKVKSFLKEKKQKNMTDQIVAIIIDYIVL